MNIKKTIIAGCKAVVAFTLAEVLIALTVIGIIAAIVVPLVMNVYEKQTYVVGCKKAYTTMGGVYKQYQKDNGDFQGADDDGGLANAFKPYFSIAKDCSDGGIGCFSNSMYKLLNNDNWVNVDTEPFPKFVLSDGMGLYFNNLNSTCNAVEGNNNMQYVCGIVYVDVNGLKGPNTIGRDVFKFIITNTGIVPQGVQDNTSGSISSYCADATQDGTSCAARVLMEDAMNY